MICVAEIDVPWPLALLAVALFIAMAAAWSKGQVTRKRTRIARTMEQLGFKPVPDSDPELQRRFLRLRRAHVNTPCIALAWARKESFGQLYLLDLWMDDAKQERRIVGVYALVVADRLNLPRFGLFPRSPRRGIAGRLAMHAENHALTRLGRIAFESDSEFGRDYAVVGENEAAVRQFLTTPRLRELSRLKYRRLEAGGDMFMYSRSPPGVSTSTHEVARIHDVIEEAGAILKLFIEDIHP